MIARIIEFSVRNRWLVILAWVGVALWGLYAVVHTPVDAIPDLSENQVIVFADWMGRSPQDIEEQITYPLSVQLQGLAGVKAVRASSEFNFSMISVIFDEKTDYYFARTRVMERLQTAQAQMPPGVVPYMAPDATGLGQIYWYTVEGEGRSLDELRAIQDYNVRYQLNSVAGVSEVASVGGMVREYQVDVDPAQLRAHDVTLGQIYEAVAKSNQSVGGKIVVENSSEYVVRGIGWLRGVEDLENVVVASRNGVPLLLKHVAKVQVGPAFRRSALEKNGREVVGGVVMMRYGQNPLEVTAAIKQKIREIQPGLPQGVRVVPFYDRTRLIESAIHTVTGTLREEMIIASIAILLILTHFRSAVVVCVTLPLAVLIAFLFMYYLQIPSNIMSLCGIAISIGILVDAAVVMVENASHELKVEAERKRAERPAAGPGRRWWQVWRRRADVAYVEGDTTETVIRACRLVGRPIFFSVLIMLISFLPVFAFGGQGGKLAHPLAFTKSFAMIGVAVLAITLVPALIPLFIRGRIRGEEDNWIVRSFIHIYKPTLSWIIDRPAAVWWIMAVILTVGAALFGSWAGSLIVLVGGLLVTILSTRRDGWTMWLLVGGLALLFAMMGGHAAWPASPRVIVPTVAGGIVLLALVFKHYRTAAVASFLIVSFLANTHLPKLGSEFRPDLNEGSIMDMPTSAPRIAMGQALDDVMVRDRVMNSFPEVAMVVGKVGRAETATDPSPLDMIETIVTLQPVEWWPRRKIAFEDALRQGGTVAAALQRAGVIKSDTVRPEDWPAVVRAVNDPKMLQHEPRLGSGSDLLNRGTAEAVGKFDAAMRELAHRRQEEFRPVLAKTLTQTAYDDLLGHLRGLPKREGRAALRREPTAAEREAILEAGLPHGRLLTEVMRQEEVDKLLDTLRDELVRRGVADQRDDLLLDDGSLWTQLAAQGRRVVGAKPTTFADRVMQHLEKTTDEQWRARVKVLDWELADRTPAMLDGLLIDELRVAAKGSPMEGRAATPEELATLRAGLDGPFGKGLFLHVKTKDDVLKEMDSELQMPGWGNAWTQPIINRVNMLATGVRTQIGVKVFGPTGKPLDESIEDIQRVSERIAARLKTVNGAVDVVADQAVGKRYLEITINREKAGRYGVNMAEVSQAIETALGGGQVTTTIEGRQRFPVRLRYTRDSWQNLDAIKGTLVTAQVSPAKMLEIEGGGGGGSGSGGGGETGNRRGSAGMGGAKAGGGMGGGMGGGAGDASPAGMGGGAAGAGGGGGAGVSPVPAPGASSGVVQIPLEMVADIRVVEGPSMIKSENGRLRNYVTLNVRGRDLLSFVDEAKAAVKPIEADLAGSGMSVEWSGEFEHEVQTNQTLLMIFPVVIVLIVFLLYVTFHHMLDTLLVVLAVAGALAGALMFQAIFGFNSSIVVSIGYIAAFGMATETGVIMLVYLREAVEKYGGLEKITSLEELRHAVIEGAVHRLRPKLLTEGVAIVGLVPMLWATGTGAEVMRPMAAPVLGGLLISDEVIDLMIPVLFYWVRRRKWLKLHARDAATGAEEPAVRRALAEGDGTPAAAGVAG